MCQASAIAKLIELSKWALELCEGSWLSPSASPSLTANSKTTNPWIPKIPIANTHAWPGGAMCQASAKAELIKSSKGALELCEGAGSLPLPHQDWHANLQDNQSLDS